MVSPHATGAELDTLLQAALPVETTTVMPIGVNVQMHPFTGCTDHTLLLAVAVARGTAMASVLHPRIRWNGRHTLHGTNG